MPVYTVFKSAPNSRNTEDASSERDIRSRQIDELIRLSDDAFKDVYGPNHAEDVRNFYQLFERTRRMPTFRPRIAAPQLQLMLLSEAADLSDSNVRPFIRKEDKRDEEREKAFQRHWRQQFWNLQLLMAQVYSQFSGTSFLQGGFDPFAKYGVGNTWMRARMARNVYVDPISPWPEDWSWVCIEDHVYLDQLIKHTPDHTESINRGNTNSATLAGSPAGPLELPPGPMSTTVRGLPGGENVVSGGPLRRRTLYCLDRTLREPTDAEKFKFRENNLPTPKAVLVYPEGRMIVDVEGIILTDGDSWLPLGEMWPIVPVWAVPPWDTVWAPAPMKYTKSLQDAAEQQMTNTFENAKRLNQGMIIINEASGLNANSIGGLPGEIVTISPNSPPNSVEVKFPTAFPAQMIQLPQMWLNLQKELRGYTPARAGNLNPGNVGADLFEAAVSQSQAGTRLTARLFSWSVQKACELMFFIMSKNFTSPRTFWQKEDKAVWQPNVADANKYDLELPEGSIRPMSQSALRSMVIELKKAGMIDTQHGLEMLDVPEAEEISEALEKEMKLAALAKESRR